MNIALVIAFLFALGSLLGWVIELLYRNLKRKKNVWINPGFCTGPYLPIYGTGLTVLFLIAYFTSENVAAAKYGNIAIYASMAITMTIIEYIGGLVMLKGLNLRLWDYRDRWGNIQGLICPLFSLFWAILGALYYFFVHPYIIDALTWLSKNLAFSFFIGFFYGIFLLDFSFSCARAAVIKAYGDNNEVVVRYEALKAAIQDHRKELELKTRFINQLAPIENIKEHLDSSVVALETKMHKKLDEEKIKIKEKKRK